MRTHTEYECNLCFLKVIEMKEGMKETGVMLDHELHIPDSLQPLNTAISPVLKHPFFSFIGLLFVLFLAPSLPVVTDEHNARKIYSNSCPHKRKRTKLLSARCADSKNIFLSVEQNSKFVHIQKEKKKHTAVVDCLSLRTPVKHCLAKTNEHVPSCCDK